MQVTHVLAVAQEIAKEHVNSVVQVVVEAAKEHVDHLQAVN